jgi:hypothetical protein
MVLGMDEIESEYCPSRRPLYARFRWEIATGGQANAFKFFLTIYSFNN